MQHLFINVNKNKKTVIFQFKVFYRLMMDISYLSYLF